MKLTAEQRERIRLVRDGVSAEPWELHYSSITDTIGLVSPKSHRINHATERRQRRSVK